MYTYVYIRTLDDSLDTREAESRTLEDWLPPFGVEEMLPSSGDGSISSTPRASLLRRRGGGVTSDENRAYLRLIDFCITQL